MRWPWKREHVRAEKTLQRAKKMADDVDNRQSRTEKAIRAADHQLRTNNFAPTIARALGDHR